MSEPVHPIETLRDGAELIRVLERLATLLEWEKQHDTEREALERGQWANSVLYTGAAILDAAADWRYSAQVPFAAVTVSDSDPAGNVGPLVVVNSTTDTPPSGRSVGSWAVPAGGAQTIALLGTELLVHANAGVKGSIVYVTVWTRWPGLR